MARFLEVSHEKANACYPTRICLLHTPQDVKAPQCANICFCAGISLQYLYYMCSVVHKSQKKKRNTEINHPTHTSFTSWNRLFDEQKKNSFLNIKKRSGSASIQNVSHPHDRGYAMQMNKDNHSSKQCST